MRDGGGQAGGKKSGGGQAAGGGAEASGGGGGNTGGGGKRGDGDDDQDAWRPHNWLGQPSVKVEVKEEEDEEEDCQTREVEGEVAAVPGTRDKRGSRHEQRPGRAKHGAGRAREVARIPRRGRRRPAEVADRARGRVGDGSRKDAEEEVQGGRGDTGGNVSTVSS